MFAVWLVHIPAVQAAAGVSKAQLGTALLALGVGSLVSMQVGGALIARFGARKPLIVGLLLMAATLLAPAFAVDLWTLIAALLLFGIGNGLADVAMNAEAVEVQRDAGRAIISSMHAFFSVGTAAGAGYGWVVQTVGLSTLTSFAIAAGIASAFGFVAYALLPERGREPEPTTAELVIASRVPGTGRKPGRTAPIAQMLLLGLLAFTLMLAEGVASDWSALHAVSVLGEPEAHGSLAYGAFALSMTAARFCADFAVRRFGSAAIVRYGSLIAAAGMLVVVAAPSFWVALIGWTIFGLGVAAVVPQVFSAAGDLPVRKRAVVLARIVGVGYLGMLSGPAIVGWLAAVVGLNTALVVPALLCLLGVVAAASVGSRKPAASTG